MGLRELMAGQHGRSDSHRRDPSLPKIMFLSNMQNVKCDKLISIIYFIEVLFKTSKNQWYILNQNSVSSAILSSSIYDISASH